MPIRILFTVPASLMCDMCVPCTPTYANTRHHFFMVSHVLYVPAGWLFISVDLPFIKMENPTEIIKNTTVTAVVAAAKFGDYFAWARENPLPQNKVFNRFRLNTNVFF